MTDDQIRYAGKLWLMGCDTHDIARILRTAQARVHNALPKIREAAKARTAA